MKMPNQVKLKTVNGWAILPSSLKHPDATSRFNLIFPSNFGSDAGAQHLVLNECADGYELPTRNLIERTLRSGDLFVDVGAHWGFFTLQAATHPAGKIDVISFEPEPINAFVLSENVLKNKLADVVTVISAACGNTYGFASLVTASTMGHSIRGVALQASAPRGQTKWVPVVPLDAAIAQLRRRSEQQVILKIDAEGYEPEIVEGAKSTIKEGRIKLIIWECGDAFFNRNQYTPIMQMISFLSEQGFRHFQPPSQQTDGPLTKLNVQAPKLGNVFSFAPQLLK
jgi:FkbM family methyltransferase